MMHQTCASLVPETPQDISTSTKNYFKKVLAPLQTPIVQEFQVLTILESYVNYTMDKAFRLGKRFVNPDRYAELGVLDEPSRHLGV